MRPVQHGNGVRAATGADSVDLSVLMPCYNNGTSVATNIGTVLRDLEMVLPLTFELVVIDDGSTDGTHEEARRAVARDPRVRLVRVPSNSGKGAALRSGFDVSQGDLVCFLDGDLQISARNIPRFIEYLRLEAVDVVVSSKRHPLSTVDYPRTRRILSRWFQLLTTTLFGLPLTDTQAGLKVFRREVLERIIPRSLVKRYAFDVELLSNVHRLGYRITEAPIRIHARRTYESHVNLRAVMRMFRDTMGIFYRMYITRYYDRIDPPKPGQQQTDVWDQKINGWPPTPYVLDLLELSWTKAEASEPKIEKTPNVFLNSPDRTLRNPTSANTSESDSQ